MDQHAAVITTLVICLVLLIAVYYLGLSTGHAICAAPTPIGASTLPEATIVDDF
jgi:hypothetical protein